MKLWHCAVTRQDIRLLPTASTSSLSSYFMFSGVSAYFIGFSDVGRNMFSKWLEIETEHSVRCTKPSYKNMHSEVFSCPAKSCDVRMLWIQCSEVYRSAHCKACYMLVQLLSRHPMFFTPPKSQHRICVFLVYSGPFCLCLFHFVCCFIVQCICMCSINFLCVVLMSCLYITVLVQVDGRPISVQLCDTAGQVSSV